MEVQEIIESLKNCKTTYYAFPLWAKEKKDVVIFCNELRKHGIKCSFQFNNTGWHHYALITVVNTFLTPA